MKTQAFNFVAPVLLVVLIGGAVYQNHELRSLRTEETELVGSVESASTLAPPESAAAPTPSMNQEPPPAELLALRNEATRLSARHRELAAAEAENQRLRQALAARQTNGLPAGYLRRGETRFAGYNTPENTLQSCIWALHNRDTAKLLEGLTPAAASQVENHLADATRAEEFWKQMQLFLGYRILKTEHQPSEAKAQMEVEIIPGLPPAPVQFQFANGRWQMTFPR